MDQTLLWIVLLLPLVGLLAILLGAPARLASLTVTAAGFAAALALFLVTGGGANGIDNAWRTTWLNMPLVGRVDFGFNVDGVSMPLILLSTAVAFAGVLISRPERKIENEFFALVLVMVFGATAAFASIDLVAMYVFHEVALIPTFVLIGRHGHGAARASVALRMSVYLVLGSLIALVGIIGLLQLMPEDVRTSNFLELQNFIRNSIGLEHVPAWIYPTLFVGFGILFGLFPFHSWAPAGYAASPAAAAMIHAGVLKNFGIFILLKTGYGIIPPSYFTADLPELIPVLSVLVACNILLLGFAALRQERLDLMLGYLSLMHMGYLALGLLAETVISQTAVVMLMFGHGLATAALFGYADRLRALSPNLRYDELEGAGGKAKPLIFAFGLAAMASIGLPGLAPFAGEVALFLGSFTQATGLTVVAVCGILISALIILRAFRRIFQLPVSTNPTNLADASEQNSGNLTLAGAVITFSGLLVFFGLFPNTIMRPAAKTVDEVLRYDPMRHLSQATQIQSNRVAFENVDNGQEAQ